MIFNLAMIKEAINNNTNVTATIENIYIDFGANWKADTIVIYGDLELRSINSYQLLNPRQINDLASLGGITYEEVEEHIIKINKRGW